MKWIQNTEEQQQQQRKKNNISSEFAFYFFVHQSIIIITHVAHVELCKKKKKFLDFCSYMQNNSQPVFTAIQKMSYRWA